MFATSRVVSRDLSAAKLRCGPQIEQFEVDDMLRTGSQRNGFLAVEEALGRAKPKN
jgi:hypothetical protein